MLEQHTKSQTEMLEAQRKRQEEMQRELAEAFARLETRKRESARSPLGGNDFESSVVHFIKLVTQGGPYLVEATGNKVGLRPNCKVGDLVIAFTDESRFFGSRLVIEAKRDRSYSTAKAVAEMETARSNRRRRSPSLPSQMSRSSRWRHRQCEDMWA